MIKKDRDLFHKAQDMPKKTFLPISVFFCIAWITPVDAMVFHGITSAEKEEMVRDVKTFVQKNLVVRDGQTIDVVSPSNSTFVALCTQRTVFLPFALTGINADSITVGVRCIQPTFWTVYIQAKIHRAVAVMKTVGDRSAQTVLQKPPVSSVTKKWAVPQSAFLGMQPAVQRQASHPLTTEHRFAQEEVMRSFVVKVNQSVDLVVTGHGFSVRRRVTSLGNAFCGQTVQVRLPNGQIMAGIAQEGGTVSMVP